MKNLSTIIVLIFNLISEGKPVSKFVFNVNPLIMMRTAGTLLRARNESRLGSLGKEKHLPPPPPRK